MKNCPNCNEILGDSAEKCFACRYDYKLGRVMTLEETREKEKNEVSKLSINRDK